MCCRSAYSVSSEWCTTLSTRKFQASVNQNMYFGDEQRNLIGIARSDCWYESETREPPLFYRIDSTIYSRITRCDVAKNVSSWVASTSPRRDVSEDISARTDVAEGVLFCSFEFIPWLSPQDIKGWIKIFQVEENEEKKDGCWCICYGNSMGRLGKFIHGIYQKGGRLFNKRRADVGNFPSRKRTPRKVNLNMAVVTVSTTADDLQDLLGDIRLWRGWPFFDIKIV